MLTVVIRGTRGEGKSTLAAIIAEQLGTIGIPFQITGERDHASDSVMLLNDRGRLIQQTDAVKRKLKEDSVPVIIQTENVQRLPVSLPG